MKDKIKNLLPVGSIVRLRKGTKRLVIIGVMQKEITTGEVYDYLAVPYPEGYITKDAVFYVEHDKIEEVIAKGYSDSEREEFIEALEEYYEEESAE